MATIPYALIKGRVLQAKPFPTHGHTRPHYHLLIDSSGDRFDVAVNIVSEDPHVADVRVLYAIKKGLTPRTAATLKGLAEGVSNLPQGSPVRLDYVSDGLVTRDAMSPLPLYNPGSARHGGGTYAIMDLVGKAVGNTGITAYCFGHRYDPSRKPDPTWGFAPDDGVHNIHMNQGNAPNNHGNENGRHQDGALWLHDEASDSWSAVYVAFQTQSWDNGPDGFPIGAGRRMTTAAST
ncbi:MAG TPA: DUF2278 family protein [Isosphaeraceae bacterium]